MSTRRAILAVLGILVIGAGWWGIDRFADGRPCDGGDGVRLSGGCVDLDTTFLDTGSDGIDDLRLLDGFGRARLLEIRLSDLDGDLTGLEALDSLDTVQINGDGEVVDLSGLEALTELTFLELTGFDARSLDQLELPLLEGLTMTRMTVDGLPVMPSLVELEISERQGLELSSLVNAPALRELSIRDAEDEDWDGLADLADLERLSVRGTTDGDLGLDDFGFAAGLSNLQHLLIDGNGSATDLSPLAALPLRSLELDGVPIRSLDPIAGLDTLQVLRLRGAPITSLEPLARLRGLTDLSISESSLLSLDGVESLVALERLTVYDRPISDLGPVAGLTNLTWLSLDRTDVSDLTPLAGLSQLAGLSLWGTPVTDISSLDGLPLTHIDLNSSQLRSVAPLAGTDTLESLRIGGTAVTDLSPLRELPNLERLVPPEGSGAGNRDEVIELLAG